MTCNDLEPIKPLTERLIAASNGESFQLHWLAEAAKEIGYGARKGKVHRNAEAGRRVEAQRKVAPMRPKPTSTTLPHGASKHSVTVVTPRPLPEMKVLKTGKTYARIETENDHAERRRRDAERQNAAEKRDRYYR